jgi:hypothetical protein
MEQAAALVKADVKIIATSDSPSSGISDVTQLFGARGGVALGSMLEGLKNTEIGGKVVDKVLASKN